MGYRAWTVALTVALVGADNLSGQPVPFGYDGYRGGGIAFSYQRRGFSVFGLLGGLSVSRYNLVPAYPFDPYLPYPPPPVLPGRVIIQVNPRPPLILPPPMPEYDLSGVDLDLVAPKKRTFDGDRPPAWEPDLPPDLPGKDVSKPVPPRRPGDVPAAKPPAARPPAPKIPEPPGGGPREESARLLTLGVGAFGAEEYGLAALRFRQATAADPKGSRAHFLLAQAQFALGKYRDAVASIHAGMRRHKEWPRAPFQPRLDLYKGIEPSFDAHLKRLQATLAKAPDDPAFLFLHGHQLWFDGRQPQALAAFRRARMFAADTTFLDAFLAAAPPGPVAAK